MSPRTPRTLVEDGKRKHQPRGLRHDAIIIVSKQAGLLTLAKNTAEQYELQTSPVMASRQISQRDGKFLVWSLYVLPDGQNKRTKAYLERQRNRAEFLRWLSEGPPQVEWVAVTFGEMFQRAAAITATGYA